VTEPSPTRSAETAVTRAGDDRDALEALRTEFQARIARRSDDFDATRGLRAAERALAGIPREDDPWDHAVRKLVRD
jgi:hypothetical protein